MECCEQFWVLEPETALEVRSALLTFLELTYCIGSFEFGDHGDPFFTCDCGIVPRGTKVT